jgi:nucleoside-diphosphate-sugar epimerase
MTRIAVTGATGFVGRHLLPVLRAEGHEVRGLVRPGSTASSPEGAELLRGDVRAQDAIRRLLEGCEVVVHLAASFSSRDDVADIVETGTRNVVAAAGDAGVGRIIFVSCLGAAASAESSFYAAKWKGEQLIRSAGRPFVILRPSLVLGPGDGVLQPLAELMGALPAVPVPGSGQQRHQPIDVEDLVRCLQLALTDDTVVNESVSVGGPLFLTWRQLIDLLAGHLGIFKPKLLLQAAWLPALSSVLPTPARVLYTGPRLAQIQQGVVASPGIVQRTFGFEPRSVVPRLARYLA